MEEEAKYLVDARGSSMRAQKYLCDAYLLSRCQPILVGSWQRNAKNGQANNFMPHVRQPVSQSVSHLLHAASHKLVQQQQQQFKAEAAATEMQQTQHPTATQFMWCTAKRSRQPQVAACHTQQVQQQRRG